MIAAAPPSSPARPSRTGLLLAGTLRVVAASAVSTRSSPDEGLETAGIGFCPQRVPMRWTNDAASPTVCFQRRFAFGGPGPPSGLDIAGCTPRRGTRPKEVCSCAVLSLTGRLLPRFLAHICMLTGDDRWLIMAEGTPVDNCKIAHLPGFPLIVARCSLTVTHCPRVPGDLVPGAGPLFRSRRCCGALRAPARLPD